MRTWLPLIVLVLAMGGAFWLITRRSSTLETTSVSVSQPQTESLTAGNCIPTFVDGGGPYYQSNAPFRETIVPENHGGETLVVTGQVLARDCVTPLSNVVLDIWQANESGNYDDEWYRGQVLSDNQGNYHFTTVVPKGYGEGSGFRPPHIHFKVWQNNQELITSQMFLPASRAQGIEEAYIMKLTTKTENGVVTHSGAHNIVLP